MKVFFCIAALWAGLAQAEPEVRSEISYESGVRNTGRFDTNRIAYELSVKQTAEKTPIEFQSLVRAFSNGSHAEAKMTETSVTLQTLRASYWGDRWGISAGAQQITWSETFGYQAVDILNARDFRDYGALDHGRNRLPAWNLNGFFTVGSFKVSPYLSPQGQIPRLPAAIKGLAIQNDLSAGDFFTYPEGGVRVSKTLADSNASVFAYRHLNRLPAFVMRAPGTLSAVYRPVLSYGATFSRGFSEIVLRADGILTQDHPVSDATFTTTPTQTTYSANAGFDWTPASLENLTFGVQVSLDRFAVLGSDARVGAALMARKGLFNNKFEIEGKASSRFKSGDYWFQLSGRLKLGEAWEVKTGGEWLGDDPSSPTTLLGYTSRITSQVSFSF